MNIDRTLKRFRSGAFTADYPVLIFSALILLIAVLFYNRLHQPLFFIVADCIALITLITVIMREKHGRNTFNYWLHSWLPVILLSLFYVQSTVFDNLIFRKTFDPLLQNWEKSLFGNMDYFNNIPGNHLLIDELFHFFYFSYYLILFVPGLILYSKRPQTFHKMVYVLTLMMLAHFAFFIIFPGDGPLANHDKIFTDGILFIPLMKSIYSVGGEQGGGAFPSTHVAAAVLISMYTISEFRQRALFILIFTVGIIIATVYCSYHYLIDALAGIVTGILFYFSGKYLTAKGFLPDISESSPLR